MESNFPVEHLGKLLDELATADAEHPDVAIANEDEWSVTAYRSGFVVLENLEEGEPLHLGPLDRASTLEIMIALAEGRMADVKARAWRPGYPPGR
jgi:hypothetical protein